MQGYDFEIASAPSVIDALGKVVSQAFDVLITDLHMPAPAMASAGVTATRHAQPDGCWRNVSITLPAQRAFLGAGPRYGHST
jgi:CheY-like chemotaxis protein